MLNSKYRIFAVAVVMSLSIDAASQTTIIFSVDQPTQPFEIEAGEDQSFNGSDDVILGSTPTAIGGFGDYTYLWDNADFLDDATSANPQVTNISGAVTFLVTVTDSETECIKVDEVFVDYVVGIDDHHAVDFKIYPNPFNDNFILETAQPLEQLVILEVTGQVIETHLILSNRTMIKTSHLSNGFYFVKLIQRNGLTNQLKLCKQN